MKFVKKLLDFYINSSIHTAFSAYSFVRMTQLRFSIPKEEPVLYFAFFGTIVGYNFVKYDALARTQKLHMRRQLMGIAFLSLIAFIVTGYYFFQLEPMTQMSGFLFLVVTLLYTLPFFPNRRNARNWAGIKIYIVALCWVGVTLVLPILNAKNAIPSDFYLECIQRFLLVFILILIFEIIDLAHDDPHLQTVPQQIGVKRTKILGLILIVSFCLLEFLKIYFDQKQLVIHLILVSSSALFLLFANEKRSQYYTSFWVESIPIVGLLLVLIV